MEKIYAYTEKKFCILTRGAHSIVKIRWPHCVLSHCDILLYSLAKTQEEISAKPSALPKGTISLAFPFSFAPQHLQCLDIESFDIGLASNTFQSS